MAAPPLFTHYGAGNTAVSLARNQPNKIGLSVLQASPSRISVPNGTVLVFQNDSGAAQDLVFAGAGGYSTVSALAAGKTTSLTITTAGQTTFTFGSVTGTIDVSDPTSVLPAGLYTQGTYPEPYNAVADDHKSFENQD